MFAQLFFLMLITLITAMAMEGPLQSVAEATIAFFQGVALYATGLIALYFINKKLKKFLSIDQILFFDNIVIFLLLFLLLFPLNSQSLLFATHVPLAQTIGTAFSLFLYFFALYACNYSIYRINHPREIAQKKSSHAVRFLAPFTFPFLLATFGLNLFGDHWSDSSAGTFLFLLGFAVVTMIFLPPIVVWTWKCPPLDDPPLATTLDALCQKTHFSHGGYKIWNVAEDSITAAIIGIVPRWRYILFTKKLLDVMSGPSIEAIVAHEIGHNKRKHLWIYPWILFGMLVVGTYAVQGVALLIPIDTQLPEWAWDSIGFAVFIAAIALYFRFVFGFFSRQFERQADLYIYEAKLPPQSLIEAFLTLARSLGTTGHEPSWHHYSIRERVDFLNQTIEDPSLIQKHHRKTYACLIFFTLCLLVLIVLSL